MSNMQMLSFYFNVLTQKWPISLSCNVSNEMGTRLCVSVFILLDIDGLIKCICTYLKTFVHWLWSDCLCVGDVILKYMGEMESYLTT